ncbi:MAG: Malonyl CoA-acyl carrier protein transacylase [Cyanobacteriota bacterium erpe_2018_sw_39hr_WHONDRS-SW48-000098_B_bin.30]|nr:ACP S-malonyltransferase [Candidatus Obscuribacter sp.]MBK9619364.1 ACP S-malonyltransferase [Candidatus Obscuribacter sp.]MDQ5964865.1 Malonyl CoA-acyl carrier protein transacylase [Cyanobacteriota bacterium erpe_2018_sw_39hr_WHONDRS-SW48-000098_B_bin.30]
MGKLAIVFPGQGSQSVGMGQSLSESNAAAREAFAKVDASAGRALSTLCFEGPEAELKRTINTQPTILAASLAAWAAYESAGGPKPDFVAGHSLGEITALCVSGVLTLDDAVKLVEKRASLMENCPKGAMSAVLGMDDEKLQSTLSEVSEALKAEGKTSTDTVVVVANYNTKDQLVISGNPDAVAKANVMIKERGGKAIPLPVGGAFHSPLMTPAATEFGAALKDRVFKTAAYPVVQNVDAKESKDPEVLKANLARQMESAVRWTDTVEHMVALGVDTIVEIGPGKVLTGLVKKIDKTVRFFNVSDEASLKDTVAALSTAAVS